MCVVREISNDTHANEIMLSTVIIIAGMESLESKTEDEEEKCAQKLAKPRHKLRIAKS